MSAFSPSACASVSVHIFLGRAIEGREREREREGRKETEGGREGDGARGREREMEGGREGELAQELRGSGVVLVFAVGGWE